MVSDTTVLDGEEMTPYHAAAEAVRALSVGDKNAAWAEAVSIGAPLCSGYPLGYTTAENAQHELLIACVVAAIETHARVM